MAHSRTVPSRTAPDRPYRRRPALSVRVALCGALTAVAVCVTPAHAHPSGYPSAPFPDRTGADYGPVTMSGTIEMTPVTSHPGAQVQLRLGGCGGDRGIATSEAFVADTRLNRDSAGLFAEATVRSTVAPGTYAVRVHCDGHDAVAEGRLTIVDANEPLPRPDNRTLNTGTGTGAGTGTAYSDRTGRAEHPDGPAHPPQGEPGDGTDRRTSHDAPVSPVPPVSAVPAGGGGATLASDEPGTPGLVLAGTTALIAAGLIWHRRRNDAAARRRSEDDQ
ncbi:hypothetical protein M1P56_03740 [Streptomyces sp. HU2014]|uniref:Lipoprotein n=1 Tax=Streptomyces albireticuli TaxID=1940 RepID=A0A1Z2L6P2_9ACTN|nr:MULTISPECIES: hypothetical protein [Streptomyces]ARZ69960.1 hypothetical protein SMD11_4354 [Streptomyces albireticuli]UQI43548.1 hypothetical protein M1P56_03740 [Streptomyces sp. HU2014]